MVPTACFYQIPVCDSCPSTRGNLLSGSRGKCFVYELLKRFLREVATQKLAVDDESRSTADPGPHPQLQVLLNLRLVLFAGEAGIELLAVEFQRAGVLDETLARELGWIVEDEIVVFPKLALLSGTARSLRGQLGLWVNIAQREI